MSALAEFHRLVALADRIRARDRRDYWARVDDAFERASDEARNEATRLDLYLTWIRLGPRDRGPDRLSQLPPRVAAAVGADYYRTLHEETTE